MLFITGTKGKPPGSLNGKEAALKPWKDGWLAPLAGAMPKEDELAASWGRECAAIVPRQLVTAGGHCCPPKGSRCTTSACSPTTTPAWGST